MPLASIIITVYKRTTFLRECVLSVLSQKGMDRNDLEIIIVSNTNVSSYDLSVDQIIYTEDRSIGKKLLLGINASHSEILFLLEDDDYFFPKKIKTILPFFTDANVGYVHNNVEVANDGKVFTETVERIDPSWLRTDRTHSLRKVVLL